MHTKCVLFWLEIHVGVRARGTGACWGVVWYEVGVKVMFERTLHSVYIIRGIIARSPAKPGRRCGITRDSSRWSEVLFVGTMRESDSRKVAADTVKCYCKKKSPVEEKSRGTVGFVPHLQLSDGK